uniref:Feline leukemia virus subgroup C cellular receptor family, member 2a n=1 Tax=Stegastes partitus TaxID=144197 RepID=A0A3B5AFU0_9TELE
SHGMSSTEDNSETTLVPKTEIKLYHRRWVMLFLFSAVSASNAFMWLQYGIISNIFMRFYNIDSLAIDWLAMIYLLTYIPLIMPILWLLDNRGIRDVVLVGSAFNCIGAWIKIGSPTPEKNILSFHCFLQTANMDVDAEALACSNAELCCRRWNPKQT